MKNYMFTMLLLCSLIFAGCGKEQTSPDSDVTVAGKLEMKVGDSFVIKLKSNPTTGYSWSYIDDESGILKKVSNEYEQDKTNGNLIGSGGTELWTFKAIKKGGIILKFHYARPWEKDVPPIEETNYQITVK